VQSENKQIHEYAAVLLADPRHEIREHAWHIDQSVASLRM
jgi:hypothetical protein